MKIEPVSPMVDEDLAKTVAAVGGRGMEKYNRWSLRAMQETCLIVYSVKLTQRRGDARALLDPPKTTPPRPPEAGA